MMRTYTVEVTWRVSEYAHLIVKAETPEAATAKALECSESGLPSKSNRAEDQDGDIQILKDPEYDYEAISAAIASPASGKARKPIRTTPPSRSHSRRRRRKSSKRRSRRCLGESTRASEEEQRCFRSQGQQRRFVRLSPNGSRRADA